MSQREKHLQLEAILKRPPLPQCCEDIHIVMCCWKWVDNLAKQFENMNTQTVAKRIVFHLVNNNLDNQDLLQQIVNTQLNIHHECATHRVVRDHLVSKSVNYMVIIDDDQQFTFSEQS